MKRHLRRGCHVLCSCDFNKEEELRFNDSDTDMNVELDFFSRRPYREVVEMEARVESRGVESSYSVVGDEDCSETLKWQR